MSNRTTRLIGLYAVVSAAAICVVAPLLSLAYFATKDGAYALETSTTSAWADPARRLADGLLTFAAPERVYGTYLQAFALIFPAVLLCALVVRSTRPAQKPRAERWGWRIALLGYGLLTGGLAVAFCMESVSVLTGTTSHNGPLNVPVSRCALPRHSLRHARLDHPWDQPDPIFLRDPGHRVAARAEPPTVGAGELRPRS